ncbi:MAG: DUF2189 domain-containing protein [Paracoccaceae bacterium]
MTDHPAPSTIPPLRSIALADLPAVLLAGARYFGRAPLFGLFFSLFYVLGGIVLVSAFRATGESWWAIPFIAGFPILAPFAAVGLYEVSRALGAGEAPRWARVLGAVFAQRNRQIPSMAVVILMLFMFWVFVGHAIFALFMGMSALTNISTSYEALLTTEGLTMLAVGTIIGGGFSMFLYCITVISLPLLLDREVDFVTAMITSFAAVLRNPVPMLVWAALIASCLFIGMLPAFLGLFIVMPVLGHASWHMYRRLLP